MRTYLRGKITLLFMTCAVLLAIPAVALADIVANNIDATVEAQAEQMPLTVGGANGTTKLYVINQNEKEGDTNGSCNLAGATTNLKVDVTSSNPSVATVNPASATIQDCGDAAGVTLTVWPVAAGSTTITVARTEGTTNTAPGTFDFAPATFTVNVSPPPNTAPTVTVEGVDGGAEYNKGSVPNATCQVTDAEDGNSSFAATLSSVTGLYASDGIGSQTASCSYTDGGNLKASASETYNIIDPSAPVITNTVTGQQGLNGWYTGNVNVNWTVSDPQSPNSLQTTGCADFSVTSDQNATTYTCKATSAGGTSSDSVTIKRDATAPTINASRTPSDANGWNNSDVTVNYTCSDSTTPGSGLASGACPASDIVTTEGADQSVTGNVTDQAGNTATKTVSNINIDKTAPTVAYKSASPAANANGWNKTNVTATFEATDSLSGMGATDADKTATNTAITSGEGTNVSVGSPAFTDRASNTALANTATSPDFKIDKTKPSVSVAGVSSGDAYTVGNVPTPNCDTTDGLSDVKTPASVSVTGGTGGFGTLTATCSGAVDNADNNQAAPVSVTYNVQAAFNGFLQPIDGHSVNTGKYGRTYPIKWQLKDSTGALISDSSAQLLVGTMTGGQKAVSCTSFDLTDTDALEESTTGSTALRYDAISDQFIYNYKAPTSGTCYVFAIRNADGVTTQQVDFKFTK